MVCTERGLVIERFQGPHHQPGYHEGEPLWLVGS